jgi:hypothetical protein
MRHAWERRGERTGFWWESPKERVHSESQGIDGRVRSEWILMRLARGVDWIRVARGMEWWRAVVSAVKNLRVFAPQI